MLLVFFMDGVKYDMMKKHMPFLSSLNCKHLKSEFGYSCACHATMYTSKFIDQHGTWFTWKRGNHSPYKWINYIPFLKFVNNLPLKLIIGKITRKFSKNTSYPGVPCLINLPLKYWPLFEPTEKYLWNDARYKPNIDNLFSILKENKIKNKIIALHRNTKKYDFIEESKNINFNDYDFLYFFIGYTDNIMHKYGETNKITIEYFKEVDNFIYNTYKNCSKENNNVSIIAFSDHGHIELVNPKIDINNYFKKCDCNVNNYIHLIESNYARFWFRNDKEKEEIFKIIELMIDDNLGYIIDENLKNKYHLNLNPSEHGELIFYLEAPREFTKTIWGYGKTVKSGHGYCPELEKHYGIFCTNKQLNEKKDFVLLTDILPSILEFLNIEKKYSFEGEVLFNHE